jgi:hypothetical protein
VNNVIGRNVVTTFSPSGSGLGSSVERGVAQANKPTRIETAPKRENNDAMPPPKTEKRKSKKETLMRFCKNDNHSHSRSPTWIAWLY